MKMHVLYECCFFRSFRLSILGTPLLPGLAFRIRNGAAEWKSGALYSHALLREPNMYVSPLYATPGLSELSGGQQTLLGKHDVFLLLLVCCTRDSHIVVLTTLNTATQSLQA
jgi:hypothetical protein